MSSSSRLHQLFSPVSEIVDLCCGQLAEADVVLLADRGVELLASPAQLERMACACAQIFVLRPDALARGLAGTAGVVFIDDRQWPALVRKHQHVLSWS